MNDRITVADNSFDNLRTGWVCNAHRGTQHRMLIDDGADALDWPDEGSGK